MLRGIDLSSFQGRINWAEVAKHVKFAMIRVTHFPGHLAVDDEAVANLAGSRTVGLPRGVYHFPGATDPTVEADFFVDHADHRAGEPMMLDCEGALLRHSNLVGWCKSWLDHVYSRTGVRALIYMSAATVTSFDWSTVARDYPLVVAKWGPQPANPIRFWGHWSAWQDTDKFPVAGISGEAPDGDWFDGAAEDWWRLGGWKPAPAPVKPAPPAPKPVPPKQTVRVYTVKKDDTLGSIARMFKVKGGYEALAKFNNIKNPNLIFVDQVLHIPN